MAELRDISNSDRPKPPEVGIPLFLTGAEEGALLMGSAIRVAENVLLSCSHCLEWHDRAQRDGFTGARIETNEENILNVLARDLERDLVLLRTSKPVPAPAIPLVFQTRKPPRAMQILISGYPGAFEGEKTLTYDGARILLTGTSGSDGSLYDVQFTGGLSPGVSGAAVLGWVDGEWRCIAMARLGGLSVGHSRGVGAGLLVEFLRANKIDVAVAKDTSPGEPVAKLVIGGQPGRMIQRIRDDDELQPPFRQERNWTPSGTLNIFRLLDWRAGLIPLGGRDDSLNKLLTWARSGCDVRVRFLAGPGGCGKSRLAREAVEILHEEGWTAGETFLDPPGRSELISSRGLFLVIDDPEPWRLQVRRLLQDLARIGQPPAPIRVLFVSRLPVGEWRSEIDQAYFRDVEDTRIGPLERSEAIQLFSDAIQRFSQCLARPVRSPGETAIGQWLDSDSGLHRLPLFIVAAALHCVLMDQTDQDELQLTGAGVIEALMRRERERIDKMAQDADSGWAPKSAPRLVGLAALGELDSDAVRRLEAETEIGLPKGRTLDAAQSLGFWQDRRVPAPKPDIVAAEFLFAVLKASKDQASAWLWAAIGNSAVARIDDLGRLAYDIAKLRGRQAFEEFAGWLAGTVKDSSDRARQWKALFEEDSLPAGVLPLAVEIGRQLRFDPSLDEDQRAEILTNLSNRLYDAGKYFDALEASGAAVAILRRMTDKNPARHECQFAEALRSHAACLWKEGDIPEALKASRESVDILRRLARLNSADYEPNLARSLRVLCNGLSASSDNGLARDVMRQAVEIWTRRQEESGRYTMELAQSLNNLAVCLYQADDLEAACASIQKAIDIWRKLVHSSPARYEPGLALALCSLSYLLRDTREQEADGLLREGIEIYSRVAQANPAHEPEFARGLEELAHNLNDTERAIDALKQASEIRRRLALSRPERSEPGLVSRLDRQLYRLNSSKAVGYLKALRVGVKTVCVLLVRGEDPEGKHIFAYMAVRADKLEIFMEAQLSGMFYPEDFGVLVESGKGDPSPEIRTKMETEYGFNHKAMIDIPSVDVAGDLFMNLLPSPGNCFPPPGTSDSAASEIEPKGQTGVNENQDDARA